MVKHSQKIIKIAKDSQKIMKDSQKIVKFYLFIYSHIKPYIYTWLHFHINVECNEVFSIKALK